MADPWKTYVIDANIEKKIVISSFYKLLGMMHLKGSHQFNFVGKQACWQVEKTTF